MTVEAITPPEASREERLRARALDTIRVTTMEVILASDGPMRTVDVSRLVAERLDLRLNDAEQGGLASLVRMVLDSDPLFSQSNRQWDLALRMGRAEADRRKPVERAIEDFTDLLGHPVRARPVSVLVASVYQREPEYYEKMIDRLLAMRPQFFRVGADCIGITRWLPDLSSDDPEEVEEDNFSDTAELERLRALAPDGGDALGYARALIAAADGPVSNRALLFLAWAAHPETEPAALFNTLHAQEDLRIERGPCWTTAAGYHEVLDTIRTLARTPDEATELVASTVPAEDEEIGILAPTTVRVSDEDLDHVHSLMERETRSYRVTELCQQALEAFPGSRTYTAFHDSLLSRLREDPRFVWVGAERYRLRGTIPPEIEVLPEGMAFDDAGYLGEDETEVDRFVDVRDWKFNLDEQILHYLVQDVGDDGTEPPGTTPVELYSSPPLHHYVAGTRYLRTADRGFFPTEPDLVHVTLVTPDDSRFDVWVNNRLGLIFGLKEWYDANLPWVGGRFHLRRGSQLDEYELVHSGEVEPLMDIPVERLQVLLALRNEAAESRLPLTEVVTRILRAYPEGLHFVTLFTELNVLRRTRRAMLASILSGQRYFQQHPQTPGIWHYDEKRAAKAKRKGGPKRPMREYDEDEFDIE